MSSDDFGELSLDDVFPEDGPDDWRLYWYFCGSRGSGEPATWQDMPDLTPLERRHLVELAGRMGLTRFRESFRKPKVADA